MSRAIGDKIAHSIGVINEPEILVFNLDEESKFILLGSDGVWQYLNNQEINDIIFCEKEIKGEIVIVLAGRDGVHTVSTEDDEE